MAIVFLSALIFAYAALVSAAEVGVLGMMVGIIMYGAPLSSTLEAGLRGNFSVGSGVPMLLAIAFH